MNKTVCLFVGAWVICFASYFAGYQNASQVCELEKAQTLEKVHKEYANALENKNAQQAEMATAVTKSQTDLASNIERTTTSYNSLISSDLYLRNNWVQPNSATDSKERNLPSNTRVTSTVSGTKCKCSNDNGAKLQRLYKQQLTVAKDCDITTSYYNSLLHLYQSVKHAQD